MKTAPTLEHRLGHLQMRARLESKNPNSTSSTRHENGCKHPWLIHQLVARRILWDCVLLITGFVPSSFGFFRTYEETRKCEAVEKNFNSGPNQKDVVLGLLPDFKRSDVAPLLGIFFTRVNLSTASC